jgi:hypothetical protein
MTGATRAAAARTRCSTRAYIGKQKPLHLENACLCHSYLSSGACRGGQREACLQLGLLVVRQRALLLREDAPSGSAGANLGPPRGPGARERPIEQREERRARQRAARLQHLHACAARLGNR